MAFIQHEYRDITVTVSEGTCAIRDLTHATSAYLDQDVDWSMIVTAKTAPITKPSVNYEFLDGPGSILITTAQGSATLTKGQAFNVYFDRVLNVGETITVSGKARFTVAGTYKVRISAGVWR